MSTSRKVQSFDAGAAAYEAGLPYDTYIEDFFVDRQAWKAGWRDAEYIATCGGAESPLLDTLTF